MCGNFSYLVVTKNYAEWSSLKVHIRYGGYHSTIRFCLINSQYWNLSHKKSQSLQLKVRQRNFFEKTEYTRKYNESLIRLSHKYTATATNITVYLHGKREREKKKRRNCCYLKVKLKLLNYSNRRSEINKERQFDTRGEQFLTFSVSFCVVVTETV